MASVITRRSTVAHRIGKCYRTLDWELNSDKTSALGTQALLEAVVHYDQFQASKQR